MGAATKEGIGTERRLTAFGTTKTVAEWAMAPRAAVWGEAILARLEGGMSPEQAIATPVAGAEAGPVKVLAFGERKTLRDWADDVRCAVSRRVLKSRLDAGWAPEAAISTPNQGRTFHQIAAWGETKGLVEWERDARAGAGRGTILKRLREGMGAEAAISTPATEFREDGLTAFGETKSTAEWAADPRCSVGPNQINSRLRAGMTPEEAVAADNRFGARLAQNADVAKPEGMEAMPAHTRFLAAFGETKSLNAWSKDPRCSVSLSVLVKRLNEGEPAEAAITEPSSFRWDDGLTAFGETRTLSAWADDPRCAVTLSTLVRRLDRGMAPEAAIAAPNPHRPRVEEAAIRPKGVPCHARSVVAFGETKTLMGWARDPRCPVTSVTIAKRLDEGMEAERAITAPDGSADVMLTAFGETKNLSRWAEDPRCPVGITGLSYRVAQGWAPETAISKPRRATRPARKRVA